MIDAAARPLGTDPSTARSYLIAMLGLEGKASRSYRPRLSEAQRILEGAWRYWTERAMQHLALCLAVREGSELSRREH